MAPFVDDNGDDVTAQTIRASFGAFDRTLVKVKERREPLPVIHFPALYAARLTLKFTSTEASISLKCHEWKEARNLKAGDYTFTDGIGTLSSELADRIWRKWCESRAIDPDRTTMPSAVC